VVYGVVGRFAEELGEELDIRRLAAAGAGARKFEQRLEELRALGVDPGDPRAVHLRQVEEERIERALALPQGPLRRHVDRLPPRMGLVLGRADLDAESATGAVLGRYLQGVQKVFEVGFGRVPPEAVRRSGESLGRIDLGADGGMRADQGALVALDAQVGLPDRDLQRQVALLPARRPGRPGAIDGECGDRQQVPLPRHHHGGHLLHEIRRCGGHHRRPAARRGGLCRHLHLVEVRQRGVHYLKVALHHLDAARAVGLFDRLLDMRDRLVARQHAGDREEAGLHDGIDPPSHPRLARHLIGVDHGEAQPLLYDLLLDLARQVAPDRLRTVRRVEQEDRAGHRRLQHVEAVEEIEVMAGHEACPADQIGRTDRPRPEAQVRDGHRAGLFRVVDEIALGIVIRLFADDLDRILVGPHSAVRAEPVEKRADNGLGLDVKARIERQRGERHVVDDADRKVILRPILRELVEDRLDHRRIEFLGR
jgi:hypothetical protein